MDWSTTDSEKKPKWLIAVFILFFIMVGGTFWYDWKVEKQARDKVLDLLSALSPAVRVTIDGHEHPPAPVLEALARLRHVQAHHSQPLKPVRVEIRDGGTTIELAVAQDSTRPDEYWVFRPGPNHHNDPLGENLGRIEVQSFGQAHTLAP
jgi:hypothetical protein